MTGFFDQVSELVRQTSDTAAFRSDDVPPELINRIVEASTALPVSGDGACRVLVVSGAERERLIAEVTEPLMRYWRLDSMGGQGLAPESVLRAPVFLLVFSSISAAESLETFSVVASAAQNMMLLANAEGLGVHRMFAAHVVPEAVLDYASRFLGHDIRDGELVHFLALGWPDAVPHAKITSGARPVWADRAAAQMAKESCAGSLRPPADVLLARESETVFVIDSYRSSRDYIVALFRSAGYDAREFSTGAQLVEELKADNIPRLLVASDTLPDLSGLDLVRALRRKGVAIPFIMTTMRRDSAFRIAGLSAGVDYYLRKPVNSVELLTAARILIEQKRLVKELERVTTFQRALIDAIHSIGVVVLDHMFRAVYVSSGWLQLTGSKADDLLGQPLDFGRNDALAEPIPAEPVPRIDMVVKRQDGVLFDAELFRSTIRDSTGKVTGYVAVLVDIADRKQMERRLRHANGELERLVEELRIAQAQSVQQAKMAALGQLVAAVAHEINTPLAAVVSNQDLFARRFLHFREQISQCEAGSAGAELEAELDILEKLILVMQSASKRITEMVRTLRTYVRLDEAEVKIVDLHEGLETTLVIVAHLTKEGIQVVRSYGTLPPIECHPNAINQVFMNVLVNACQAMGKEGTLTITTSEGKNAAGAYVSIAFRDTGPGMTAEQVLRIFEPGFTTKPSLVGTGYGMSIAQQIVDEHGGKILIDSKLGKGTEVTVQLPVAHIVHDIAI